VWTVREVIAVHATRRVLAARALLDDERPVRVRIANLLVDANQRLVTGTVEILFSTFTLVIIARERGNRRREHRSQHYQGEPDADAPTVL
jgi:hypothetical protein